MAEELMGGAVHPHRLRQRLRQASSAYEYRRTNRGGQGITNIDNSDRNGPSSPASRRIRASS
jgi:hypothetical protein